MIRRAIVAIASSVVVLVGCGSSQPDDTVVVSAAASLTELMTITERFFEDENPGIDLQVNIGGSATLVNQVLEGAPVDVILTADAEAMGQLGDLPSQVDVVARNRIAVLHRNDEDVIASFDDLADPGLIVVACDLSVPCGRLTERTLVDVGAEIEIDSRESSVRLARERVLSGEADAAFVYRTDLVRDDERVDVLEIVESDEFNEVVIGTLTESDGAQTFRDFFAAQGDVYLEIVGFEIP